MNKRYIIGAIVAAVVAVAVIIPLSLSGGDDAPAAPTAPGTAPSAELLRSVPQDGATLGSADAPVEVVEYADMQCPFCATAAGQLVPQVIRDHVRGGDVKLTFRAIAFIGADSERGALGMEAAEAQDRTWNLAETLFARQGEEESGWLSEDVLGQAAVDAGLDAARFAEDFQSDAVGRALFANQDAAETDGVTGTPYFVITGPGGREVLSGAVDLRAFDAAIEKVST